MKTLVIDSSAWLEYAAGGAQAEAFAPWIESADPATHYTPTVVLYEVYKRTKLQFGEQKALERISEITSHTTVINLNPTLAITAAEISMAERLAFADAIIRATAKNAGATIVTADAHFEGKDDVEYISKKA